MYQWMINRLKTKRSTLNPQNKGVSPFDILVVDDDPIILELLQSILNEFRVRVAISGQDAWNIVLSSNGCVKIIITDYNMPGMMGDQFLRIVRGAYPNIKRVLCSGSLTDEDLYLYNELYHEAIKKPFLVDDVIQVVKSLLSPDYVPKTIHTNDLRKAVMQIKSPPPPELMSMLNKLASMSY